MTTRAVVAGTEGIDAYDDLVAARESYGTTWVALTEPTEAELAAARDSFDLHPLSIEDIQNSVRPKTEMFYEHTFVLIKTACLVPEDTTFDEEIDEQSVGLFVGDDWLVTISETAVPAIERAWNTANSDGGHLLGRGPDFAAYRVIDAIVDGYFTLLDDIETEIEYVEDELLETTDIATLEAINSVRRELLVVRKLLWPTRDAVGTLARGTPDEVRQPNEKYFRDVYDHLVQLVDLTETYRDLTASARDIYLNTLSQSTNEVMKRLTVVATIVLPLTFVAGIFGMNFSGGQYNMPELTWTFGYPAVMLGMAGMAAVLLWYFRRSEYI